MPKSYVLRKQPFRDEHQMTLQFELDQDGHLIDYNTWNAEVAQILANNLDIQLEAWHLTVLEHVRLFYQQYDHAPSTRPLIKFLTKQNPSINNAILQQSFNTGLVARQLCRLAGLPKPANCL